MLERQREGIAVTRVNGFYKGRIRGYKESEKEFLAKYPIVVKHLNKGQSLRNTAKLAEVSFGAVQKVKRISLS